MPTDLLRIEKIRLGGRHFLDIRRCISTPSGIPVPTKRGISIPYEKVEEVLSTVRDAVNGSVVLEIMGKESCATNKASYIKL